MEDDIENQPPEKTTVQILGSLDLKTQLKSLESEVFDHLNSQRIVDKYWKIISTLDTSVRNEFGSTKEFRDDIIKVENHKDVKGQIWDASIDPWYRVKLNYEKIVGSFYKSSSYKDWQIGFLEIMLNKTLGVLESIQGASEEKIRSETMSKNLTTMMNQQEKMYDKQMEMTERLMKNISVTLAENTKAILSPFIKKAEPPPPSPPPPTPAPAIDPPRKPSIEDLNHEEKRMLQMNADKSSIFAIAKELKMTELRVKNFLVDLKKQGYDVWDSWV